MLSAAFVSGAANMAMADISEGLGALNSGDIPAAAAAFQTAFEAGEGDGAFYLGRLFELGLGTEADLDRAAQLYAAGVSRDSAPAMNRLGLMYLEGTTVLRNFSRAAELICKGAELGDANAQFNCGTLYQDGKGVDANIETAMEWWGKASEQGNIAANNYIGLAWLNGTGVEADAAQALPYFEQTAAAGNAMGLYEAARIYADAEGPATDLVKSYAWANLAAVRAHPQAASLRDALEAQLSADEIVAGQELAASWTSEDPEADTASE